MIARARSFARFRIPRFHTSVSPRYARSIALDHRETAGLLVCFSVVARSSPTPPVPRQVLPAELQPRSKSRSSSTKMQAHSRCRPRRVQLQQTDGRRAPSTNRSRNCDRARPCPGLAPGRIRINRSPCRRRITGSRPRRRRAPSPATPRRQLALIPVALRLIGSSAPIGGAAARNCSAYRRGRRGGERAAERRLAGYDRP